MRLKEFAPGPDRDDDHDGNDLLLQLANRWWNAADPAQQDRIATTLKSLGYAISQVESEDDAVQITHLPTGHVFFISADDFDPDVHEAVNHSIMRPGWQQRQHRGGLDLVAQANERGLSIMAHDRLGREIGAAHFEIVGDHLESFDTYVRPDMRHQGIATVMYDWAQELGNDLRPSGHQTGAGKRFWKARQQPQPVSEIARIPQGDFGDKDTLEPMPTKPKTKSLPGGSRFSYAVNRKDPEFMEIMIFDGDALVAEMDLGATLDPLKTWQVETIATDPDYRGQGLGKALYGIALTILKLTVEAGATQTKHGQAMWIMLNSIPGVKVQGYAMDRTAKYRARPGDQIVDQNDTWTRYTFPVEPGKRSMRSTRPGTGIYSSQYVSMIARWTGA